MAEPEGRRSELAADSGVVVPTWGVPTSAQRPNVAVQDIHRLLTDDARQPLVVRDVLYLSDYYQTSFLKQPHSISALSIRPLKLMNSGEINLDAFGKSFVFNNLSIIST